MKFKQALIGVTLAASALGASAALTFTSVGTTPIAGFNADGALTGVTFSSGSFGTLYSTDNSGFSLTFLGQESDYSDGISIVSNGTSLTESSAVGSMIMGPTTAGQALGFSFFGSNGGAATNGGIFINNGSFVVLGTNVSTSVGTYAYLIGFNDSFTGDADYDDYVVGVNAVSPIPEPETYALMLAGLGAIGISLLRRRRAVADNG